jgi:hypothetical protein
MASQINYDDIDEAFPIEGRDNSSAGFRSNFQSIKTAFSAAKTEISELQLFQTGLQGATGQQGLPGERGPAGAQGIAGEYAAMGADGAQGIMGAQGIAGEYAAIGLQGLQGFFGETGPAGAQGIAGEYAAMGLQGLQGFFGQTGNTGTTGPSGLQGIQGVLGSQGSIGLQGIQGVVGPQYTRLVTNLGNVGGVEITPALTGINVYTANVIYTGGAISINALGASQYGECLLLLTSSTNGTNTITVDSAAPLKWADGYNLSISPRTNETVSLYVQSIGGVLYLFVTSWF